jgi:hypothetical protein
MDENTPQSFDPPAKKVHAALDGGRDGPVIGNRTAGGADPPPLGATAPKDHPTRASRRRFFLAARGADEGRISA